MAKIREVIAYADSVRPNVFSNDVKVKWLNEIDGMVQSNVMKLAPENCVKHEWEHRVTAAGILFAESTIAIPYVSGFREGEGIAVSGCTTNPANNKSAVISAVSEDGKTLSFPAGCFTAGTESVAVMIVSDRSGDETIVKFPHDKLYGEYLCARICEAEGEIENANNDYTRFNDFYDEFSKWFIRNYNPSGRVL